MNNLVLKRILINQIAKDNVEIEDEKVDAAIEQYRAQIRPPATLEDQIAQVGLSMEAFRKNVATELRVNKLLEQQAGELPAATDEEIKAFYDENQEKLFSAPERVTAKHILVTTKTNDTTEVRQEKREQIEKIHRKLLAGADFAELAKAESACPSAEQGGDLGTFGKGQMVPPFEAAAFSQEVGAVGDVVETDFGFHIILVTEHEESSLIPLDDQAERIGQYLLGQRREKVLKAYIDTLREAATIEIIPAS
jgi:peptidyl-prolyl cis-trans isomerase C